MIRFKQAFASAREQFARLATFSNAPQHPSRANFYQQPQLSFSSVHSSTSRYVATALALPPSDRKFNADLQSPPISLTAVRRVSATITPNVHMAHACKFSHGSGLLVYTNGALMSAAQVALKVNIAALELVRRLPIEELSAIGASLAAAFNDVGESVSISWAEVGSDTEREWHDAERSWDRFPGGPYEVYEMEEQEKESVLQRSRCYFEEAERDRPCQRGSAYVVEWLAYCERNRSVSSEISALVQLGTADASFPPSEGNGGKCTAAAAGCFKARTDRSSSWEDENVELIAIELRPILRAGFPEKALSITSQDKDVQLKTIPRSSDFFDKEHIRGSWSPGKGTGPIMSNEEFEALPDYSDVEEDSIQ